VEFDAGEVIHDCDILENLHLYDEKELYVQPIDPACNFDFVNPNHPESCHHIFFREWNTETWRLGPVKEVRVDKAITGAKLGTFLGTEVFPHITPEYLFCTKVAMLRTFKRGDLMVR